MVFLYRLVAYRFFYAIHLLLLFIANYALLSYSIVVGVNKEFNQTKLNIVFKQILMESKSIDAIGCHRTMKINTFFERTAMKQKKSKVSMTSVFCHIKLILVVIPSQN